MERKRSTSQRTKQKRGGSLLRQKQPPSFHPTPRWKTSSFVNHLHILPGASSMSALINSARVGARTASANRETRDRSLSSSPSRCLLPRRDAVAAREGKAKSCVLISTSQSGADAPVEGAGATSAMERRAWAPVAAAGVVAVERAAQKISCRSARHLFVVVCTRSVRLPTHTAHHPPPPPRPTPKNRGQPGQASACTRER